MCFIISLIGYTMDTLHSPFIYTPTYSLRLSKTTSYLISTNRVCAILQYCVTIAHKCLNSIIRTRLVTIPFFNGRGPVKEDIHRVDSNSWFCDTQSSFESADNNTTLWHQRTNCQFHLNHLWLCSLTDVGFQISQDLPLPVLQILGGRWYNK